MVSDGRGQEGESQNLRHHASEESDAVVVPSKPAWMQKFVEHRIGDRRLVHLLLKMLHAGVLEEGQLREVEEGTPQGGNISPLLANSGFSRGGSDTRAARCTSCATPTTS